MNKETLLEKIFRLSPFQKKTLDKMGLKTVENLLYYFPIRYGEGSSVKAIEFLYAGETVTVFGKISKLETKKSFRTKMSMGEATLEDTTGKIKLIWFNQPYIAKMFGENSLVRIEGKVSEKRTKIPNNEAGEKVLYFSNPKIEKVSRMPEGTENSLFVGKGRNHSLSPTYRESRGISSNWIYHAIQKIFRSGILEKLEDSVPEEILNKYYLPKLRTALIWIHAPRKKEDAEVARKRFAFEEIFFIQLDRQKEKKLSEKEKSFLISKSNAEIEEFTKTFPYQLTSAQNRVVDIVMTDFKTGHPMSRLLEGDVGSGKTAVAATTAFATVTTHPPARLASDLPARQAGSVAGRPKREFGNLQVAYMAPTEILAEQHFESFIEYFKKYKMQVGLITGSGAKKFPSKINNGWTKISKPQLLKWVAAGEIPILIGTHALIQKSVKFKNLALIIIDEQHRFGVKQRMQLRRKETLVPHLLSMTATPIPRTLALTIFGDLDLSLLDEMPPGRKPVETKIVLPNGREEVYKKVREEIKTGRQVYVICPRIDLPDPTKELAVNASSVKEEVERLQEKIFPEFKIATLTGKMNAKEKEETMREFKKGGINILVATSVIEVGVNVPNATCIIIESAERFGLAQLHQLRGRVLRSIHKPYCFVFADTKNKKTLERLKSFSIAKNGFELAEADLKQRGAGDLAGAKQWGMSDLAMEALRNIKMVEAARLEARLLITKDFELKNFPLLASRLSQKQERLHME